MFGVKEIGDFKMSFKTNFVGTSLVFTKGVFEMYLENHEWVSLFYVTKGYGNFNSIAWEVADGKVKLTPKDLKGSEHDGISFEFDITLLEELVDEWNKG